MKNLFLYFWNTFIAIALITMILAFFGPSVIAVDDDEVKIKQDDGEIVVKVDDGKAKIKPNGKVEVKGENGAEAIAMARKVLEGQARRDFKATLVKGYTVPAESYFYLEEVPATYVTTLSPPADGMVYRYFDGRVYTIDLRTKTILGITEVAR